MARKRKRGRKRKKGNKGWFKKGFDPRRKRGFPKEACKKGYASAREKLSRGDPQLVAWLWRKLRSFFRSKGTWYPQLEDMNGQEEDPDPDGDPGD
jgi:hypothetical protein